MSDMCQCVSNMRYLFQQTDVTALLVAALCQQEQVQITMLLAVLQLNQGMHARTSMECCQQRQLSCSWQLLALQQHQLSFAGKIQEPCQNQYIWQSHRVLLLSRA